jgi:NAD(P) transhydrogenase subunit alpha
VAALLEHLLHEEEGFRIDPEDPILQDCLFTHGGICRRDDIVFNGSQP